MQACLDNMETDLLDIGALSSIYISAWLELLHTEEPDDVEEQKEALKHLGIAIAELKGEGIQSDEVRKKVEQSFIAAYVKEVRSFSKCSEAEAMEDYCYWDNVPYTQEKLAIRCGTALGYKISREAAAFYKYAQEQIKKEAPSGQSA